MEHKSKRVAFHDLMPLIVEQLQADGKVRIPAMGISMYPLFSHKRDQVELSKVDAAELKKYDMILYRRENGQYVLHRIVGRKEAGFVLRGDNQFCNEYPIREDQIIARVTSFVRNGKEKTCRDFDYRVYVFVWMHTLLIRRVCGKLKRIGCGILNKFGE